MKNLLTKALLIGLIITAAIAIMKADNQPETIPAEETQIIIEATPEPTPEPTPTPNRIPQPQQGEVQAATTITGSVDTYVISKINEYRTSNGLNALEMTTKLNQTAQCRINYLANTSTWSHANYKNCFLANRVRYHFGENLARRWANTDQMIEAWKQSQTHNANMLHPSWRYVGAITDQGHTVTTFATSN